MCNLTYAVSAHSSRMKYCCEREVTTKEHQILRTMKIPANKKSAQKTKQERRERETERKKKKKELLQKRKERGRIINSKRRFATADVRRNRTTWKIQRRVFPIFLSVSFFFFFFSQKRGWCAAACARMWRGIVRQRKRERSSEIPRAREEIISRLERSISRGGELELRKPGRTSQIRRGVLG